MKNRYQWFPSGPNNKWLIMVFPKTWDVVIERPGLSEIYTTVMDLRNKRPRAIPGTVKAHIEGIAGTAGYK